MDSSRKEIVIIAAKEAAERAERREKEKCSANYYMEEYLREAKREKTEEEKRAIRRKHRINSLLRYLLFIGIFLAYVLLGTTELKHESFWNAFGHSFYYTIISFYILYLIFRLLENIFYRQ
jgi:polyferredoxin